MVKERTFLQTTTSLFLIYNSWTLFEILLCIFGCHEDIRQQCLQRIRFGCPYKARKYTKPRSISPLQRVKTPLQSQGSAKKNRIVNCQELLLNPSFLRRLSLMKRKVEPVAYFALMRSHVCVS